MSLTTTPPTTIKIQQMYFLAQYIDELCSYDWWCTGCHWQPVWLVFHAIFIVVEWVFDASCEVLPVFFTDPSRCVETLLLLDAVGLWQAIVTSLLFDTRWELAAICIFLLAACFVAVVNAVELPLIFSEVFWPSGNDWIFLLCVICFFSVSADLRYLLLGVVLMAETRLSFDCMAADGAWSVAMVTKSPADLNTQPLMLAEFRLSSASWWFSFVDFLSVNRECSMLLTLDCDDCWLTVGVGVIFLCDSTVLCRRKLHPTTILHRLSKSLYYRGNSNSVPVVIRTWCSKYCSVYSFYCWTCTDKNEKSHFIELHDTKQLSKKLHGPLWQEAMTNVHTVQ